MSLSKGYNGRWVLSNKLRQPLTKWCNPCAATINAATMIEEELELVAPFLPINRHQESQECERDCELIERPREKVKGCNGSSLAVIAAAASAAMRAGS